MFSQLFVAVYLALFTAATPVVVRDSPITIPVVRRLNFTSGTKVLLEQDQARARFLKSGAAKQKGPKASSAATFPVPVINEAVSYIAQV